jgi:RHS repeat-associated protein
MASVDADPDHDGTEFELNLRRPGQYADRESGTYYNYYRDYDPSLGRYLTSDPLGLAAGSNTYAYVRSDPMNRVDALGLYDGYVHFYMTYFLALVAGLPSEVANTIATATQYIDENPLTNPFGGTLSGALPRYHFTLDYDGRPYHGDVEGNPLTRFYDPRSPQLSNLYRISTEQELDKLWDEVHPPEVGMCPFRRIENTRYQLFGEFLHAYEDTFAHRDSKNMPYDIYSFNDDNDPHAWIGHVGLSVPDGSHAPDHSYDQSYLGKSQCRTQRNNEYMTFTGMSEAECERRNGVYKPPTSAEWNYNELRTLRMEYEVFEFMTTEFKPTVANNVAKGAKQFSWQDLAGSMSWDAASVRIGLDEELPVNAVLQRFNASPDKDKLSILNSWLRKHELPTIPELNNGYLSEQEEAAAARLTNLGWIPMNEGRRFNILLPVNPSNLD